MLAAFSRGTSQATPLVSSPVFALLLVGAVFAPNPFEFLLFSFFPPFAFSVLPPRSLTDL